MGAIQQSLFMGGSAADATDPDFSSVKLLCHFDGTNGQTTSVDSSSAAHSLTLTVATLSTSIKKFGASSANLWDTGGRRIDVADSADWAFGSGQFTIEAQVLFKSPPGSNLQGIVTQFGGSSDLG